MPTDEHPAPAHPIPAHVDPRVRSLRTRVARLREIDIESSITAAGVIGISHEYGLEPLAKSAQLPSAFVSLTMALDWFINAATRDLDAVEEAQQQRDHATEHPTEAITVSEVRHG